MPEVASSQSAEVELVITDTAGNNLLANPSFVGDISIYGILSKQKRSLTLNNERFIFFADFPDTKAMSNPIKNEQGELVSYGTSTMVLTAGKTTLNMLCTFKYTNRFPNKAEMYGGSGIHLTALECSGVSVQKNKENNLILRLVYHNGEFSVKE